MNPTPQHILDYENRLGGIFMVCALFAALTTLSAILHFLALLANAEGSARHLMATGVLSMATLTSWLLLSVVKGQSPYKNAKTAPIKRTPTDVALTTFVLSPFIVSILVMVLAALVPLSYTAHWWIGAYWVIVIFVAVTGSVLMRTKTRS